MKKKQNILVIALILLAVISFGIIILVSGKENTGSLETTKDIIKMINSINKDNKNVLPELETMKINVKNIEKTFQYIDKELIQNIDATDNMQFEYVENKTSPDFIKLCNPKWNEDISEDEAFINALRLADGFWEVYIKNAIAEVEAIEIILDKIGKARDCYIIFDKEMPYRKAIKMLDDNKVKYIIFTSKIEQTTRVVINTN